MSWLFGLRKDPSSTGSVPPPAESGVDDNSNTGQPQNQQPRGNVGGARASDAYRFDSSALERAAQAAKELEKSSKFVSIC
jgi:ATPase family AAA domain-containing protein 3A/B